MLLNLIMQLVGKQNSSKSACFCDDSYNTDIKRIMKSYMDDMDVNMDAHTDQHMSYIEYILSDHLVSKVLQKLC